ncbi:hypothetical protein TorRG33x02_320650 [Trema orientale]|uniref:Uncharacterized protein n=1 Tax=Trema orientale TaxID=63057 RepID=A0A2P5BHP9_TREOI|nr:hypothetical protein TorRG33x02_320650 [Trema orientale]
MSMEDFEALKAQSRVEEVGVSRVSVVFVRWKTLMEGCLKLNVDAVVDETLDRAGVDGTVRDWNGCTITLLVKSFAFSHRSYTVKLFALRKALS